MGWGGEMGEGQVSHGRKLGPGKARNGAWLGTQDPERPACPRERKEGERIQAGLATTRVSFRERVQKGPWGMGHGSFSSVTLMTEPGA